MHRGSCSVTLTTILWLWSLRLAVNNWCLRLRHTVRRNPRGIGAEYWPQEQPCNQIPPQHLWRGYPIDQWVSECVWMCVCVCLQGIQCNSVFVNQTLNTVSCFKKGCDRWWGQTTTDQAWILSLWLLIVLISLEPAEKAFWWRAIHYRDTGK